MKCILLKPVRNLGNVGALVTAKPGFVRNYLIPRGMAVQATPSNQLLIEQRKEELVAKNAAALDSAKALAVTLKDKHLTFIRQAGADGKLFGSVSAKDIAQGVSHLLSAEVSYSHVLMDVAIKSLGVFNVEIALHPEVLTTILVLVSRSESEAKDLLVLRNSSGDAADVGKDQSCE